MPLPVRQLAYYVKDVREAARVSAPAMGIAASFIDTIAAYGHFVELYEPNPMLTGLCDRVAQAAAGFTGDDPVRLLKW